MTGRIKLLKNGKAVSSSNVPLLGYKYDMLSEFDKLCGTHDLNDFQLPSNNQCPDKFVCTSDSTPATMKAYARCIDAMNCHMLAGMTTGVTAKSAAALFLHQMIPHHQNAVNMAKTLLILENEFICDDITDTELPDCVLESILRDIVNNQNFQIQQMFGILEIDEYEEKDDCKILIERNLRKTKNSLGTSHRDNQRANHLVLDEAVESQNVTKMNSLSIISEEKTDRRAQGGICISATKTFTVIVDLFAGALGKTFGFALKFKHWKKHHLNSLSLFIPNSGYYTFKECPGLINPTIGIEIGETHVFDQSDRSNWYHPMGFSYFPDGAHDGKAELELNITQTKSICTSNASCPAPRYLKNGLYMGVPGTLDFGLDAYEPEFFAGLVDWTKAGKYSISLNFDDFAFGKDIFYFCHVSPTFRHRLVNLPGPPLAHTLRSNSPLLTRVDSSIHVRAY